MFEAIYKPGYGYHKCGIQLSHIQPETMPGQMDLFELTTMAFQ